MSEAIQVSSIIDENDIAKVSINYEPEKINVFLTIDEAVKHGIALLKAALIAEYEADLLFKLSPIYNQRGKGFGNKNKERDRKINASFLQAFRDCRPELPDYVEPIFGYNTKKPLVNYFLGGCKFQLDINECLFHAANILQCTEACTTDKFLLSFFNKAGLDKSEGLKLLHEFSTFRKATWLENLLPKDE